MKLLLRNHCSNEFLPGCECTAVPVDPELAGLVARRADAFRLIRDRDDSLCAMRWWDARPLCVSPDEDLVARVAGDREATVEDWLERRGGWALLPELEIPDAAIADSDCARMVVRAAGEGVEVGWTCLVGDNEVRTAGVDAGDLLERIAERARHGT
jgi:hypothetical protein